jgi:putative ABC transport system substrate-binding protein
MQKPGANLTGFTNLEPALGGKWVELLREISPSLQRIAFLGHQESSPISADLSDSIDQTSKSLNVQAISVPLRMQSDLAPAFQQIANQGRTGLLVAPGAFTLTNRVEITSLAAKYRLPALYPFRYFVTVGGLASYGAEVSTAFQQTADYVDRILKGTKPSDLPVQGPTHLTLVVNAKTADSIGITITPSLLARADEVID